MVLRDLVREEPLVLAAERWVRGHLHEPLDVTRVAGAVGTSPRTLARRLERSLGTTPLGLINRIRLEAATHLLSSAPRSLDEVAEAVGYRDAGTLRRLIRRKLGQTPTALRATERRAAR